MAATSLVYFLVATTPFAAAGRVGDLPRLLGAEARSGLRRKAR
jgi:hypothetical protein